VQASLLPQETPQLPGWEIATYWKPAREVGGDYFDFINLRQKRLGLVIGDVTDKGMPAALFMASTRSILRASMPRLATPAQGLTHANHLLCAEAENPLFVTLFYASLAPRTGLITYVNAGHLPGIIYHHERPASPPRLEQLLANSPQLGMDDASIYRQQSARLEPGDCLLLYTDGVTDAENSRAEDFGLQRLEASILESARHNHKDAAGIIKTLTDDIDAFTGPVPPVDDITLMILRRLEEPVK
jgi:serine phosphatase RsbU (regulator of sigma subunit)